MLITSIENKIRLAFMVSLGSFISAILLSILVLGFAREQVRDSRKTIYVLDNDIPILVRRSDVAENREVEYRAHINLFHSLFFNLPPDDAFIRDNVARAMYLVDESGLTEYNNLKEKEYYNSILASSAVLSIRADSIVLDQSRKEFRYYGTQRIERQTSVLIRQLVTTGGYSDVPRTENNPHGCLISRWKTLLNRDISHTPKSAF